MPILKNTARQIVLSIRLSGSTDGPYVATTWPNDATAKCYYSKDGAAAVEIIPTRISATLGGWLLPVATLTAGVWNCDELRIFWEGTAVLAGSEKFYPEADFTPTVAGRIDEAVSAPKTLTAGERTAIKTAIEAAGSSLDTLLGRLSAARGGYLDNLNVGGLVASAGNLALLPVLTQIRADLERAGGMLDLTKTQATSAATSSASADGKLTAPRLAKIDGSQQAGSAVTLPNPAPTGYGASDTTNPGPVSFGPYALTPAQTDGILELRVGDLAPLEFELSDQGAAVNLTGATVTVDIRDYYSGAALTDDGAATLAYAVGGRIRYQLQAGDTNAARTIRFTAKVVFAGGAVKTYGPLVARVEI